VRGAWVRLWRPQRLGHGPSPRAWGLGSRACEPDPPCRSIPTCVGLGTGSRPGRVENSVHPHVRGAWDRFQAGPGGELGPSPRAWGLVFGADETPGDRRSIPTCVGLGEATAREVLMKLVHPHVRGAWGHGGGQDRVVPGPPPRAWGLEHCEFGVSAGHRSIPTCVGLGVVCSRGSSPGPVHPHVRGAWVYSYALSDGVTGPSPRAWGLDFPTCTNFRRYRFATKCAKATRTPVATPSLS